MSSAKGAAPMLEVAVCQELWDETALSASMHFALQIPELEAIASLGISAHSSKCLRAPMSSELPHIAPFVV